MGSRTLYMALLLVGCLLVGFGLVKFLIKKAIFKILIVVILIGAFALGSNLINLNTLAPDIEAKVAEAKESLGASSIRVDGNKVLVKINDEWYDVGKLNIVGKLATEDVVLDYEGKQIYVGHSGVVNTLKVLQDAGLIDSN